MVPGFLTAIACMAGGIQPAFSVWVVGPREAVPDVAAAATAHAIPKVADRDCLDMLSAVAYAVCHPPQPSRLASLLVDPLDLQPGHLHTRLCVRDPHDVCGINSRGLIR